MAYAMSISDWSSDLCSSDLDAVKLIRSPVDDIRIAGRTTRVVTLFRIDDSERIVSVAHLAEEEAAEEGDAAAADADADADAGDDTGDGPTEAGPGEA